MPRLPRSTASQRQRGSVPPQADAAYVLRIQLLGSFHVVLGGRAIAAPSWRLHKARSLVKLLALAPGHQMHREQVMELLWPDLDPEAAANNLYYALHIARRALAGERRLPHSVATVLRFEQRVLSLHPAVALWIDVDAFEDAAAAAMASHDIALYQAAIDLYTGDLLPDDRYEDWCISRREALRETYLTLLLAIAKLHEQHQSYQLSIESLQRALATDQTREEAHALLMRIYALAGQRTQALHQYTQLKEMLRREFDAEPDQESQRLHEDILAGRLHSPQPRLPQTPMAPPPSILPIPQRPAHVIELTPDPVRRHITPMLASPSIMHTAPIVGRVRERALLEAIWGVTETSPQFVLLAGEAGIGKTRLAEEALVWAASQSAATASAHCYASGGTLAYAPIASWLRADLLWSALFSLDNLWLTEVARILPEILVEHPQLPHPGPLAESWQRQRFEQALARSLFAGNRPLVLLLDDVQWCDRETLRWLHGLFQTRLSARLMIIATLRQEDYTPDHPLRPLLHALARNGQLAEVSVSPLDAHDTTALATQIAMREIDPVLAQRIYRETEGNPLFVVETVRTDLLTSQAGGPSTAARASKQTAQDTAIGAALPPTVQAVISARLAQLSPRAYELVQIAAVIGREFAFDLLAHVSGKDEDALLLGIDELWQRRIIREHDGDAYDFSHDKLREVAYASLNNQRRRALHKRIAQGLEATNADALDMFSTQVASHYLQAGEPDRAIAHLERAGDYASSIFANAAAEQSYRELLRCLERLNRSERAARVREKLGEILTRMAQYDEALAVLQSAADGYRAAGDAEGEVRALAYIGHVHRWRGTLESGLTLLNSVEQSLQAKGISQRTQATFYLAFAALCRECSLYSEQLIMAQRASECALAVRNARFQAQALELRGSALVALGQLDEANRVLEETIPLAEAAGDLENLREALNELAVAYRAQGAFEMDRQYTQRALDLSERIGNPSDIAFILHRRGVCAFCVGDWSQARTDLEQAEAMVRAIGTSWASSYPLLGLGLLHLAEGQRDLATHYLEEAGELAQRAGDLQGHRWTQIGLAERDILEGHPTLARDRLEPLGDRSERQESLVTVFLPLLAWAYIEIGDTTRASEIVEAALTRAKMQGMRPAYVDALRSKAILATHQSQWDVAERALDEALALVTTMRYPYGHARVLHDYGMLHVARGSAEQARERLETALSILKSLGERLYAERIEHALSSLRTA